MCVELADLGMVIVTESEPLAVLHGAFPIVCIASDCPWDAIGGLALDCRRRCSDGWLSAALAARFRTLADVGFAGTPARSAQARR